jgi:hypothetical protein
MVGADRPRAGFQLGQFAFGQAAQGGRLSQRNFLHNPVITQAGAVMFDFRFHLPGSVRLDNAIDISSLAKNENNW